MKSRHLDRGRIRFRSTLSTARKGVPCQLTRAAGPKRADACRAETLPLLAPRDEEVGNILRLEAGLQRGFHHRIGRVPKGDELTEIEKTKPLRHGNVIEQEMVRLRITLHDSYFNALRLSSSRHPSSKSRNEYRRMSSGGTWNLSARHR